MSGEALRKLPWDTDRPKGKVHEKPLEVTEFLGQEREDTSVFFTFPQVALNSPFLLSNWIAFKVPTNWFPPFYYLDSGLGEVVKNVVGRKVLSNRKKECLCSAQGPEVVVSRNMYNVYFLLSCWTWQLLFWKKGRCRERFAVVEMAASFIYSVCCYLGFALIVHRNVFSPNPYNCISWDFINKKT